MSPLKRLGSRPKPSSRLAALSKEAGRQSSIKRSEIGGATGITTAAFRRNFLLDRFASLTLVFVCTLFHRPINNLQLVGLGPDSPFDRFVIHT